MLSKKLAFFIALVLGVAAWGSTRMIAASSALEERRITAAAWKEKYTSVKDLVHGADAIVLAVPTETSPSRVAYSSNGEDALPFEITKFSIVKSLKGGEGSEVSVERAGGVDPEGVTVHLDADGGEFEIGSTYLIFLKKQESGNSYYQINDQARFRVEENRLRAVNERDMVTSQFHGRLTEEGFDLIRENLQ